MPGHQKLKCTSCGATFMSEKEITDECPSCSKRILDRMHHESIISMGGPEI